MRKLRWLLLIVQCFTACQHQKQSNPVVQKPGKNTSAASVAGTAQKLALSGTATWKADSVTGNNVNSLRAIIVNFNVTDGLPLQTYLMLASDLQTVLDKMVKECKMKGPDHDALHHWLLPLVAQVKQLKQAESSAVAGTVFQDISRQVYLYYQYFE